MKKSIVVQLAMEASLAAGHSLMSPLFQKPHGSAAGVGEFNDLIQLCHASTASLAEVLKNFWGLSVQVVFLGISNKTQYFWRMDDFHVSQLALENSSATQQELAATTNKPPAMATLRLSDSACDVLLERVLGSLATPFSFKQLSPLEGTILNEFSRDVLTCLKKELLKKSAKVFSSPTVHLIWVIQPEPLALPPSESATGVITPAILADFPVGKIIFSVPFSALKHWNGNSSLIPTEAIPDPFFYHVQTVLPIYLGSTKVQLAELEQLEPEDLIILENSQLGRMALIDPASGQKVPFLAEIHHPQRITIPYTQEFASMEAQSHSAKQSLWDNLMIEVDASFEPIKLPLKQLKQMTEGLVIEMGDLVHNRIALQVEGKTLAWGELLIVGDKFAVRVSEIIPNPGEDSSASVPALTTSDRYMEHPSPGGQGTEHTDEEDEFLDNDFDDMADDEEDW